MSYPKPLSEKTLKKMYIEANIDEAKSDFLHQFFLGASNLYGCISISKLWDIYFGNSQLKKGTRYHKSDFIKFSSIARREDLPYRIYEIDDIYKDEERKDIDRMIVNMSIINWYNPAKPFQHVQAIENSKMSKNYYIPYDMFDFIEMKKSEEEIALENYLGNLEVTAHPLTDVFDKPIESEDNRGKKLKEVYYLSRVEKFLLEKYSEKDGRQSPKSRIIYQKVSEDTKGPENEKLVRNLKDFSLKNDLMFHLALQQMMNELYECGVELKEKQINELFQLAMHFVNNIYLYSNAGWKPDEMPGLSR